MLARCACDLGRLEVGTSPATLSIMLREKRLPMARCVPPLGALLLVALVACEESGGSPGGPQAVSPQPQPSRRELLITAPCTAEACGEAPTSLRAPRCRGAEVSSCGWSESDTVSYRACAPTECGAEPSGLCPAGTTFAGNQCGSENEAPCAWTTTCVPPRSTTPCPEGADACGPKPEIGVVCADGSTGDLACMLVGGRCEYQRTCD